MRSTMQMPLCTLNPRTQSPKPLIRAWIIAMLWLGVHDSMVRKATTRGYYNKLLRLLCKTQRPEPKNLRDQNSEPDTLKSQNRENATLNPPSPEKATLNPTQTSREEKLKKLNPKAQTPKRETPKPTRKNKTQTHTHTHRGKTLNP